MYKSAMRAAPRRVLSPRSLVHSSSTTRRLLSTAPPSQKARGWKSSAARWMLAIGGIYYYNTSNVFAEEPEAAIQRLDESLHRVQESNHPTLDAIVDEKRQREARRVAEENKSALAAKQVLAGEEQAQEGEEGMGGLEEEADQQGAFNPETGEINWDCPCLGGMAHGPCGDEFKAAFSCFVYSNEEPKGVECIEKFKGMQDCFRQHPEMYGSELEDDEDEVEDELLAREVAASSDVSTTPSPESAKTLDTAQTVSPKTSEDIPTAQESKPISQSTTVDDVQQESKGGGEIVPKASHDASSK